MTIFYYFSFSGVVIAITAAILGLFVYYRNPKNIINQTYALFNLSVFFWAVGYIFWPISSDKPTTLYWFRILHMGAIFIPITFFHFTVSFLSVNRKFLVRIGYILGLFFLCFSFSPLYIKDMRPVSIFRYWGVPGPLYHLYLIMYHLYAFYACYLLYKEFIITTDPTRKKQVFYMCIGMILGYCAGSSNYILFYRVPIPPFANILGIAYSTMAAYAIVAYKLMDIEIIIKKTLVFAGLLASTFAILIIPTLIIQEYLVRNAGTGMRLVGLIVSGIIIILTMRRIETFLINITDKYLFQKRYDPRQVIRSFIDYVATVLDLSKIVSGTIELLEKIFHPKVLSILLPVGNKDRYVSYGEKDEFRILSIENSSQILGYLESAKTVLSVESENYKKINEDVKKEMHDLKVTLAVPLILQDELLGIMLLGKKKSDEYYAQEDLNILMDLARTLAIALKNAEFIKERDAMHMEMMQAKLKEELATMADGMSHQFNNKFQGISSAIRFAKQMLSGIDMVSQSKEKFQNIIDIMTQAEDTALAAGDIATGLLNFTRPKRVQYEMVNITSNINVALQLVEYKHKDFHQIEVIKEIKENVPLTYAHLGYFQEIYFIAIDNAYDAIQGRIYDEPNFKGRITISVTNDKKNNELVISIIDNGSGMKPDVLEKVRNAIPYFTTKGSSGKSGYGAGTQVLRRLVDFHKGKISYDSTYGKGTTITIRIPITEKIEDTNLDKEGKKNG